MKLMRKLYLLSKPLNNTPILIGVLSENNGEFRFEYKLGGEFPYWWLAIEEFPNCNKIYDDKETRKYVNRIIPEPNSVYINNFLKNANLEKYDEWGLLKYCGAFDFRDETTLTETLPKGAYLYEQVD
jgi:hypothetical protein